MPYAVIGDVQARLPGTGRQIGASTQPSTTQVEDWIDQAEAELNGWLVAYGCPAPYATTHATNVLKAWVADYVSGLVQIAQATAGGSDGSNTDGQRKVDDWKERMMLIRSNPGEVREMLALADSTDATALSSHVTNPPAGYSAGDASFEPRFKIGMKW